ncbi:MAG: hypothetical protein HQ564_09225 [Candidatus Saganbacteria bacterium]|nr:hypothetical protein [Candidatus Saganbacteria bacterium]
MIKELEKVISFGYKVSDGDHEGFAYFLQHLRVSEQHGEIWRDLVVDVITKLPIETGKQVLKAILRKDIQ